MLRRTLHARSLASGLVTSPSTPATHGRTLRAVAREEGRGVWAADETERSVLGVIRLVAVEVDAGGAPRPGTRTQADVRADEVSVPRPRPLRARASRSPTATATSDARSARRAGLSSSSTTRARTLESRPERRRHDAEDRRRDRAVAPWRALARRSEPGGRARIDGRRLGCSPSGATFERFHPEGGGLDPTTALTTS